MSGAPGKNVSEVLLGLQKSVDYLGIEMRSSSFDDYLDSLFVVHGLFVEAFGGKGVVDIREGSLRPNTKAREYPC